MFTCQGCGLKLFPRHAAYENVCLVCLEKLCRGSVTGRRLCLDFDTALAIVTSDTYGDDWRKYQVDYPETSQGSWRLEKMGDGFAHFAARVAFVMMEGPARDIGPGPFTRLVQDDGSGSFTGWMTDSRVEVLEHYPLFDQLNTAKEGSTVLINGLGLGVAALAALREPNIARVDVVEIDEDVAALVEPFIRDDRLTVHLADAHEAEWPEGQTWDLAWHDIWPDISPDNLPSLNRLRERYSGRAGWRGAWAHE